MRPNWVIILLVAILVLVLVGLFIDVDITGENDKRGSAPIGRTL
jgi:hypothetical protein